MAIGDLVYILDAISIDADGVVTIRTSTSVVGQAGAQHRLRPSSFTVTPSPAQVAQIDALRASLLASLVASPPSELAGQTNVAPPTAAERQATRDAARAAARANR